MLRYDANGNPIPDLATAVPTPRNGGIGRDGRTITVHLRRNALWADGAPITAADWLLTYRIVRDPNTLVKSTFGWDDIASAQAPDPYTLVLRLRTERRGTRYSRLWRCRVPAFAGTSAARRARFASECVR